MTLSKDKERTPRNKTFLRYVVLGSLQKSSRSTKFRLLRVSCAHVRTLHATPHLGRNPGLPHLVGPARNLRPHYNLAPTDTIDVARRTDGGRELVPMRWGLIPSLWKKPLNELPTTFNARAETVAVKAMFQSAFKSRRCIIPASGFYEWTGPRKERTPHYFSSPSGEPLAFAGLWESWRDPVSGETIPSATIVVCGAKSMDDVLPRPCPGVARAQRLRSLAFRRCNLRKR